MFKGQFLFLYKSRTLSRDTIQPEGICILEVACIQQRLKSALEYRLKRHGLERDICLLPLIAAGNFTIILCCQTTCLTSLRITLHTKLKRPSVGESLLVFCVTQTVKPRLSPINFGVGSMSSKKFNARCHDRIRNYVRNITSHLEVFQGAGFSCERVSPCALHHRYANRNESEFQMAPDST